MGTEVWGISMVRNEADIIGPVMAHMATQVDHVLVADNLSTDATRAILEATACRVVDDTDPAYRQSDKMTALAHQARAAGAAWVVPFDADEIWHSPLGRIADVLTGLDVDVAHADLYDHVPTSLDDEDVTDPTRRIGWRRREPGRLGKVACRTAPDLTIAMGNHAADYGDDAASTVTGQLVVRHFPYRTREQFVAKAKQGAAALALTQLPRSVGAHWREYGLIAERDGDDALADVFTKWFYSPDPYCDPGLIHDPAPVA